MLTILNKPIELRVNFNESRPNKKPLGRYLSLTISSVPFTFLQGDVQVTALETSQKTLVVLVLFKDSIIYQHNFKA